LATKAFFCNVGDWSFVATVLGTKVSCYIVGEWRSVLRFWRLTIPATVLSTGVLFLDLANDVSCYSVGNWRFVASVLATNFSCYNAGDCNFTSGMSRTLLSGGCRVVVPRSERGRPLLVT